MIEVRAPGKLYVAGEYAVVEPGGTAVAVAVDRYVTVRAEPHDGERDGEVRSAHFAEPLRWQRRGAAVVAADDRPLDHVLSAIGTVEALVADLGLRPRGHALQITSELDDDASGRKYGLGSSAAVTVAVVRALAELYGLRLSRVEEYRLALLATLAVAPSSSGGDLAASCLGGWVGYRSPDRAAVLDLRSRHGVLAALRADWPYLELEPLPQPRGLALVVGWTGEAASTTDLVQDVHQRREDSEASYERFLAESRDRVAMLTEALRSGAAERALTAVREARRLLAGLGTMLGIAIETPALTRLCDAAEQAGAAAKSSGAGGGDCGIVLARQHTDLSPMLRAWQQAGIRRLELETAPTRFPAEVA